MFLSFLRRIIKSIILPKIGGYFKQIDLSEKISYSKSWYEKYYHEDRFENLNKFLEYVENAGYKKRLYQVLDHIQIPKNIELRWLEPACNKGKTVFWSSERYPLAKFFMFDFNMKVIKWLINNNPIPTRTLIWQCDIQNIHYRDNSFDNFFDLISCIDVTEHLTEKVYFNSIKEFYRVLKPGGYLIVSQGIVPLPTHINIRPEKILVFEFLTEGFSLEKRLPHRHYLFRKNFFFSRVNLWKLKIQLFISKLISNILKKTLFATYTFFEKIKFKCYSDYIAEFSYEISKKYC